MGDEIRHGHFRRRDFNAFESRLREETALLARWIEQGRLSRAGDIGGFELEAWLVDQRGHPAPLNDRFLERLDSPLVVPELARFNIELNTAPRRLAGDALAGMERELAATWRRCEEVAHSLEARMAMIGILPTVTEFDLSLDNISERVRYRALNEQVLRLRQGAPLELRIDGPQPLHAFHRDVMLEAGTTSFQIHLQVSPDESVRYFNAAIILSAPMVAACANSPYLFGHDLWEETRIPLFEQAVSVCAPHGDCPDARATFGHAYAARSLIECFQENLERYAVLLPEVSEEPPERLCHLRLHNGTIWRWNRALIGFDPDGTPHLRIEHRVVPAGPTVPDAIANAAMFFGMARALAGANPPPESRLTFETARANFYAAARTGLGAEIAWLDGRKRGLRALLLDELLPAAQEGLGVLGIDPEDRDRYLGIIRARLESGQTGACWQRRFVEHHGPDRGALTAAYLERQSRGDPVHTWTI
jgi:hypothetical protein